jgi:RNA polymerase sigma-70 factor, ECF subfamily
MMVPAAKASEAPKTQGLALQRNEALPLEVNEERLAADRLLVQGLLSKSASSWHTLVTEYGRLVRARVSDVARSFGYVADSLAIDDATADVFTALCANDLAALRAFAGRSSLGTYLAVISTRSATRNFARKRNQSRGYIDAEVAQMVSSAGTSDPAKQMLLAEEQTQVRELLALLPEKQREVVQRFYLDGQSYSTISSAMEIPIGSVGVTLQRAEARLRKHMEPPS